MKKGLLILVLAFAVGVAAFFLTRSRQLENHREVLLDSMPELAWLRKDLALTDGQFEKVSDLHAAYRPQCAEMCRRIAEAQARLEAMAAAARGMTPELAQAIQNNAQVRAECRRHMLEHLYQTAAVMDGRQASRYLESVLPAALDSPTCGAKSCPHH